MTELSGQVASGSAESVASGELQATQLNQSAVEFMIGAQKLMFEEFVFYTDEMLERTRTEMKLFTEFAAKMAALTLGNGTEEGVDVGPLITAKAREGVDELVQDALAKGANALTGGDAPRVPVDRNQPSSAVGNPPPAPPAGPARPGLNSCARPAALAMFGQGQPGRAGPGRGRGWGALGR